jgi:hypothetical protein
MKSCRFRGVLLTRRGPGQANGNGINASGGVMARGHRIRDSRACLQPLLRWRGRVLTASAWVRYGHGRAPVNRIDYSGALYASLASVR